MTGKLYLIPTGLGDNAPLEVLPLVFSCQNSTKLEKEISQIEVDLNIERFDL
jgi:hypothetical protein